METQLKEQKDRELAQMKAKYEQIIAEMKRNAKSDQDFMSEEFKK